MTSVQTSRRHGVNGSLAIKAPCKTATTANITLSGLQTIDGVTVVAGDRVLVKNQTDGSENGIYAASTSTWQREPDWDGNRDIVKGTHVYVTDGSTTFGGWRVTTANPISVGSSAITFDFSELDPTLRSQLADTSTDDGTKGFHLVSYPPLSGETGIENHAFARNNVLRFIPISLHDSIRDGTNATDLYSYIRNAYTSIDGGTLHFPSGVYLIGTMLDMDGEGGILQGASGNDQADNRTEIKVTSAINAIRMSVLFNCHIRDIYINGTNTGLNGIVAYNSGQGTIRDVIVKNFTLDGILFDSEHTTPTGSINLMKFTNVYVGACNRGFAVNAPQLDCNGLEFYSCNGVSNTAEGMLLKGENHRVFGGNYSGNGTYGIQISESGDGSNSVGSIIHSPWLESNTSGGYRGGGKSVRNLVVLDGNQQGLSNASGSEDLVVKANNSAGGIWTVGGGDAEGWIKPGTASVVFQGGGSPSNIDIYFRPKGTGAVHLDDQGLGGVKIGGGTAIAKHLSATQTFDPANLATDGAVTSSNVTVTGAEVGDTAYASHDQIGANDVMLSANVYATNLVRVTFMNKTGGAIDIASGTLRVDVWKH